MRSLGQLVAGWRLQGSQALAKQRATQRQSAQAMKGRRLRAPSGSRESGLRRATDNYAQALHRASKVSKTLSARERDLHKPRGGFGSACAENIYKHRG